MNGHADPHARDRWVVWLERSAPWIVGAILAAIVVLWLLASILDRVPRPVPLVEEHPRSNVVASRHIG